MNENFDKLFSKQAELRAREKAFKEGSEAFQLIMVSNAPKIYIQNCNLIIDELKKNGGEHPAHTQEQIDIIKKAGETINATGGREMMIICFKVISGSDYIVDNHRCCHQTFISCCWDGVGEWLN